MSSQSAADVLSELEDKVDLVLIDAPPILDLSDTMTLSGRVDGLVVITRLPSLKRSTLQELHRVLSAAPTAKLGFVLTGAAAGDSYGGYGDGYGHGQPTGSSITWEASV